MSRLLDLTGNRYGRLVVSGRRERRKNRTYWECRCDCGNTTFVLSQNLRTGNTSSCGCWNAELTTDRNTRHGQAARGGRRAAEYTIWALMVRRCVDPSVPHFDRWGGRGISVCERWHSYENFIADMGKRPTSSHQIDRIDNDGHYEPGNCRWATRVEQANNRSDNVHLTHGGETLTMTEWGRRTGIGRQNIWQRINRLGWSVERTLTTPPRPMRR